MTVNQIKLFAMALFFLPLFAVAILKTGNVQAVSGSFDTVSKPDEAAAAATYKSKCAMCHSPKAEKAFDPSKSDEYHLEIILKGKKDAKPPMPGFEARGMTKDEAQDLVDFMRKLRNPDGANSDADKKENAKEEAKEETNEKAREAIIALYKSKCAACHSPKAERAYNPQTSEDTQVQIILKGKKDAKPPMPAYENQGITEKQAKALAAYMMELRTPSS